MHISCFYMEDLFLQLFLQYDQYQFRIEWGGGGGGWRVGSVDFEIIIKMCTSDYKEDIGR
jgi:hypothetical protein